MRRIILVSGEMRTRWEPISALLDRAIKEPHYTFIGLRADGRGEVIGLEGKPGALWVICGDFRRCLAAREMNEIDLADLRLAVNAPKDFTKPFKLF